MLRAWARVLRGVAPDVVVGMHITAFTLAPLLSVKALDLGLDLKILGGALLMLIGNGFLDVVNEAYGATRARFLALSAMVVRLLSYLIIMAVVAVPSTRDAAAFDKLMSQGFHVFLAGEATHLIIQLVIDIEVFDRVRRWSKSGFALRYNLSNLVSIPATNFCFVSLVVLFGWVFGKPAHAAEDIPHIVVGTFLVRWPVTVLMTPLYSALARLLKEARPCESSSLPSP